MLNFLFPKKKHIGDRGEELPLPNEGLPDSHRSSGLCPRCNNQSSFELIGSTPVTFNGGYTTGPNGERLPTYSDRVSVLVCRHCSQGTVVIEEEFVGESPSRQGMEKGGFVSFRGFHWWPLPNTNMSADVPTKIAEVFSEAIMAQFANCPRASAVMARRTLEAITVDKGESKGTLAERLAQLGKAGILHPSLAEWAKEVRLIGNLGAHYDPINSISEEDAIQLIGFVKELIKFLYELPAELERRRNPAGPS